MKTVYKIFKYEDHLFSSKHGQNTVTLIPYGHCDFQTYESAEQQIEYILDCEKQNNSFNKDYPKTHENYYTVLKLYKNC